MENNDGNNRIRKVLFNEVSLIVSILAVAFGAYLYFSEPVQDQSEDIIRLEEKVKTLNENHIPHLEDAIDKLIFKDEKQDELILQINGKLERILGILEK